MQLNRTLAFTAVLFLGMSSYGHAGALEASQSISAPPGFSAACHKNSWMCSATRRGSTGNQSLSLLRKVNASVNGSVKPMEDADNYGVAEKWTLPANGRGDCEDYAMLKMKRLIEAGFGSDRLALSVVLDRRGRNHVVLIARMPNGDYVLDNQAGAVKPWMSTGYTFLARQSFVHKRTWQVALVGPEARRIANRTKGRTTASVVANSANTAEYR